MDGAVDATPAEERRAGGVHDGVEGLGGDVAPDGLPVGQAVATGAGDLPARWVIHTVGPNRHAGETDPALLASCFRTSLAEAVRVGARSVAFPAVSAGIYGWDGAEVARIAVATVAEAPERAQLDLVRFVLFSDALLDAFATALHAR